MLKLVAAGVCALLVVILAGGAAYRAYAQSRAAEALVIRTPNGIDEAGYVSLGGVKQWVQIRGEDRRNPVLLILHGGPGMSYIPFTQVFRPWERDFTVVLWDRRGVGRTYRKNGTVGADSITFDRLADDGVELVEHLCQRLEVGTVTLVGHSVGSLVGALIALKRPERIAAYVGADQIVDGVRNEGLSFDLLLARVRSGTDPSAKKAVARLGAPPYTHVDDWFEKQKWISATDPIAPSAETALFKAALTAPNFTTADLMAFGAGLKFSAAALLHEMMTLDLRSRGTTFRTPVVLIEGERDVLDPTSLAVEWFHAIEAPAKDLVIMQGLGHGVMLAHSDAFLTELLRHVRPIALTAGRR